MVLKMFKKAKESAKEPTKEPLVLNRLYHESFRGSLRFLNNWNPGHSFDSELFFKELEHAVL
jgi:hypothetical protein